MDHHRINYDLIVDLLIYIDKNANELTNPVEREDAAILVFLPGMPEIQKLSNYLLHNDYFCREEQFQILSLHSVLQSSEAAKAFDKAPDGFRKIVLSTNIAETGVTIPDVVFVVDTGRVKQQTYFESTSTSSLKEQFVSQAEATQRRGRAGRVQPGVCFHLFTEKRFDNDFKKTPLPELLRSSLSEIILSMLSRGMQADTLNEALDPPRSDRVDSAIMILKSINAIDVLRTFSKESLKKNSHQNDDKNELHKITPTGTLLVKLPTDVRIGKLILFGAIFNQLKPLAVIAASLSHKSPFLSFFDEVKREQAKTMHLKLCEKSEQVSDHLAVFKAYDVWDNLKMKNFSVISKYFKNVNESLKNMTENKFIKSFYLSQPNLVMLNKMQNEFQVIMKNSGFKANDTLTKSQVTADHKNSNTPNDKLITSILTAGLYPNIATIYRATGRNDHSSKPDYYINFTEKIKIHPSSLTKNNDAFVFEKKYKYCVFYQKLKTSQLFLKDITYVRPQSILLFGPDYQINFLEKTVCCTSGFQTISILPRFACLIKQLRFLFDEMLERKVRNPFGEISGFDREVLDIFVEILMVKGEGE